MRRIFEQDRTACRVAFGWDRGPGLTGRFCRCALQNGGPGLLQQRQAWAVVKPNDELGQLIRSGNRMTNERWTQVREGLRGTVGANNYTNWIEPLEFGALAEDVATFHVPTTFIGNYVSQNLATRFCIT